MKTTGVTPAKTKRWAVVIGVGLALYPVHNKWLTDITSIDGQATVFVPALATVVWLMGTCIFLLNHWQNLDWGDRRVYVPLLLIVGAIGLSGVTADSWGERVAPLFMGSTLFALYLVARLLGRDVFIPLAIGVALASFGIIIRGMLYPGLLTGGFVFEGNYDIATGYVLLGAALAMYRWQWGLVGLALVAMFISGSPEAVFVLAVLGVFVLWRRDWSKRLLFVLAPLLLLGGLYFAVGYGQELYAFTIHTIRGDTTAPYPEQMNRSVGNTAVSGRWDVVTMEMGDLQPLGKGYNLTAFSKVEMVHNVPLVIVQQLGWPGILAGLAWLWVTVWCLVKTKWRYVWVLILALSVFDHYIWTQLAPLYWAVVGVSTASTIESDLMFRRE